MTVKPSHPQPQQHVNRRSRSPNMNHIVKIVAKFLTSLVVMTIVCTAAWEVVNERLYDCTDSFELDYWQPGNWVHREVAVVQQVVHHRAMSERDTIKDGWSVAGLWCLWYSFVALSVVASIVITFLPWIPRRWRPTPTGTAGFHKGTHTTKEEANKPLLPTGFSPAISIPIHLCRPAAE